MTWVVVPAAGRGVRAGEGLPKQYRPLAGRPLMQWTLQRLLGHGAISGVMVALAAEDRHWPGWSMFSGKPVRTCLGGDDRAASVLAGLHALASEVSADDFVLVHDAARPCLSNIELDALLTRGSEHPVGALLALPVSDTLKQGNAGGDSIGSLPRDNAWRALTPQMFRRGELIAAIKSGQAAGAALTDEASAFERLGRYPLLVAGDPRNLKVTTAGDFVLAEAILAMADDLPRLPIAAPELASERARA